MTAAFLWFLGLSWLLILLIEWNCPLGQSSSPRVCAAFLQAICWYLLPGSSQHAQATGRGGKLPTAPDPTRAGPAPFSRGWGLRDAGMEREWEGPGARPGAGLGASEHAPRGREARRLSPAQGGPRTRRRSTRGPESPRSLQE